MGHHYTVSKTHTLSPNVLRLPLEKNVLEKRQEAKGQMSEQLQL